MLKFSSKYDNEVVFFSSSINPFFIHDPNTPSVQNTTSHFKPNLDYSPTQNNLVKMASFLVEGLHFGLIFVIMVVAAIYK